MTLKKISSNQWVSILAIKSETESFYCLFNLINNGRKRFFQKHLNNLILKCMKRKKVKTEINLKKVATPNLGFPPKTPIVQ